VAREQFGLDAVEYVNGCFARHHEGLGYITELKRRAADHGVKSLLIMVDGAGRLGDPEAARRTAAVTNHHPYVEAAVTLGCHSIRVNAASEGSRAEQRDLVADGLHRLATFADPHGIDIIVENHGGLSSDGAWLAEVMRQVAHPRCGTLPDFGNFLIGRDDEEHEQWYDRYRGVRELMPFARAVSAKSHDFDDAGNEKHTDYDRMMRLVLDAGYRGYVGIEYEGAAMPEADGITATKRLLERVRDTLTTERRAAKRPAPNR
jgi:sugar phosphate isomerase/epimerase